MARTPGSTSAVPGTPKRGQRNLRHRRWVRLFLSTLLVLSGLFASGGPAFVQADSLPGLAINDVSKPRPTSGTSPFTFTVSLTHPTNNTVTVAYKAYDGSARSTFDYQPASGTVTFAPNKMTATFGVVVNGTTLHTGDRYFTVQLSNPSFATIVHGGGTGTIVDTSNQPYLTVGDATVAQGSGTTNTAVFPVSLSSPSANTVKVHYYTQNSSAVAGADYTAESGTLAFAPGVTSLSVNVPINAFNGFQSRKDFYVRLNTPVNAAIEHDTGDGVILNNNHQAYLTADDVTVAEPASGTTTVQVPVRIAAGVSFPVTVAYGTSPGSAAAGTDYVPTSGTLNFPANATLLNVPITIKAAGLTNPRSFSLTLGAPSAGATLLRGSANITIYSSSYLQITVSDTAAVAPTSAGPTETFTVVASPAPTSGFGVNYQTVDGSAVSGTDYTARSGSLNFGPGVTTQTVSVPLLARPGQFSDKYFSLNLSAAGAGVIERGSAYGELEGNAVPPVFSVSSGTVTKPATGSASMAFVISISALGLNSSVNYSTQDGSATSPTDYTATSGTVTFTPTSASTMQTINVPVNGNTLAGADKIFYLNLSSPTNGQLGGSYATAEIQNPNHDPTMSISNIAVYKPQSGTAQAKFTVSLSSASPNTVTAHYSTSDGSAVAGRDYNAASGTITLPAGSTSQVVSVSVLGNTNPTGDLTFYMSLSSPTNTSLVSSYGQASIIDSSIVPFLSVSATAIQKPATVAASEVFTVTLSPGSPNTVTVKFATQDGSARAPGDYTSTNGTLTFAPGVTTQTFNVPVQPSKVHSGDLYYYVYLSSPTNASLGNYQTSARGFIIDPNLNPLITADDASAQLPTSGPMSENFTVHVYPSNQNTVTVHYATQDGSAHAGTDYTAATGDLTFGPGATSQTVSVPLLNNSQATDTYFYLTLSSPVNGQLASRTSAYGLIVAAASAQSYFTLQDQAVAKPSSGTTNENFTVNLFPAPSSPVNINYATSDGSASASQGDYSSTRGTLTFGTGVTSETVSVPVNGNTLPGPDKYFSLNLSANTGSTSVFRGQSYGFILNGQPSSYLWMGPDVVVNRGDTGSATVNFSVNLSSPQAFPVQFDYTTTDGTAQAPEGYVPDAGTLTLTPGQTSKTISITIPGNPAFTTLQGFYLDASNAVNSQFVTSRAEALIYNLDTFTIKGKVVGSTGAGTAGVNVTRSGNNQPAASVTTAADGTFSFPNTIDGVYRLTPALAGTTFLPANLTVTVLGGSITAPNFLGYTGTGITGLVASSAGAPVGGTTVTLSGGGLVTPVTTTTDSLGYYAFSNVASASGYSVTPSGGGYAFNPGSYSVNVTSSTVKNQDFVAVLGVYITGRVATAASVGDAGVTITRSGGGAPTATVKTNSQGYYGFSGDPATAGGVTYTITPAKTGQTFTPPSANATVSTTTNATGVNFTQN